MRVLTLQQPFASLVVMGVKGWETRGWKPSDAMLYILRQEGLLIHSSQKMDYTHQSLCTYPPFKTYVPDLKVLPFGPILGYVSVGRVITADHWLQENPDYPEEYSFGNYTKGRWAWELPAAVQWELPIQAKGSLSLWEYNAPITLKAKSPV